MGCPAAIPAIYATTASAHDVGINEGNFDFVVVADFASADDYVVYRDHPLHRALISERIAAPLAERAAVQFDTPLTPNRADLEGQPTELPSSTS